MKRISLCIILICLSFSSCHTGCEDTSCFTPPAEIVVQILNQSDSADYFLSSNQSTDNLNIVDKISSQEIQYYISQTEHQSLIFIQNIGWDTQNYKLVFDYNNTELFIANIDAQRVTEDCCNFTRIAGFTTDADSYVEVQSNQYKVYLP